MAVSSRDAHEHASEVLNQCLSAVEAGQAEVQDCVSRFPESTDLKTLLVVALSIRQVLRPMLPIVSRQAIRQLVIARYRLQWRNNV